MSGEWRDLGALFVYASALKNAGLQRALQPIGVVKVRQPTAERRTLHQPPASMPAWTRVQIPGQPR